MKGNSIQSWILDSTPRITNSRFRIPWSLSVKLGFWIPIVSGIPDSLSCIPDFKDQDFGFHKQKISPDSGIRIPLRGAKVGCFVGKNLFTIREPEWT